MIEVVRSPATESFTPITFTVCATFQLFVVNVRLAGDTVAAVSSALATATVTSPEGTAASCTV